MNLHLDPAEFVPLINEAVDAALQRFRDEQPSDAAGKLLLSKREAATALSMSVSGLDRLTHPRGDLRPVRLDGRVLFSQEELRRWIAAKENEG